MDAENVLRLLNLTANYGTLFALGALAYVLRGGGNKRD